ncbi:AI-2E family transporter [Pengzhenrongella frigida]|uniref:AI-2E family transporter n=1 Tax=Pengzhenrongella frigida TaxID=1259133 RepID=A0A4Q5N2Y2_9MICO|nr:AI-2E family transporter [Cellulomonas sp. HLT2-17]RYV50431.1 AI-2E family transporter [Cellulomonas sp. HLT2-17]
MRASARTRPESVRTVRIMLDPGNVWRIGFVVLGVVLVALTVRFILVGGSTLLFTVLMAWFASLAMDPLVSWLARRMRRGAATAIVMLGIVVFLVIFVALFGQLFVEQVGQLVEAMPNLIEGTVDWVNRTLGTEYELAEILANLNLTPEKAAGYAATLAGGVLAILGSVAGAVASLFMFVLFAFYLSADGPRLRLWIASLFPQRIQELTVAVWDTTAEKTGRYVSVRVLLAVINGTTSGIFFLIIGLPSWLALGIWTGLVAQFVPAIGTYISITLPVIVGLLSPNPWLGVIVLGWAIAYQQVENLTIEPRLSARAVNVHPAVSFASAILGLALFGIAGALLAIPVVAMLLTLLDIYRTRYELLPGLSDSAQDGRSPRPEPDEARGSDVTGPDATGPDAAGPGTD